MRRKVGVLATVVFIGILALGIDLAFWPRALTNALFGIDLGAGGAVGVGNVASTTVGSAGAMGPTSTLGAAGTMSTTSVAGPEAVVPLALARIAGISIVLFTIMILATWKRTMITRWLYVGVGAVAVVISVAQWLSVLPDAVGLAVTAVTMLLVVLGWLALRESRAEPA